MSFFSDIIDEAKDIFGGGEREKIPSSGQNLTQTITDLQNNSGRLNQLQQVDFENAIKTFKKFQPQVSEAELEVLRRFEPAFQDLALKSFERSATRLKGIEEGFDPEGSAIRQTLGQQILQELQNPTKLDPFLQREVEQGIRSAQTARGTARGNSAVSAEAFARGNAAEQLRRNRQQAAQNILRTNASTQFNPLIANQFTTAQGPSANVGSFQNPVGSSNFLPTLFASQQPNNVVNSNIDQFNATRGSRAFRNLGGIALGGVTAFTGGAGLPGGVG